METNLQTNCYNCSKPLPQTGYFCGGCLTQVKCKSCGSSLKKDDAGCVNCGTPKLNTNTSTASQQNINTFRLHETATDRTIEATFSDDVAKDLAGTLRDAAAAGRMKAIASTFPPANDFNEADEETAEFAEAEVVNNETTTPKVDSTNKVASTTAPKYPSMKYIVMNNLPSSEVEWIIVYGFYSSNFGEKKFTRKDIIVKYDESGRKTDQRIKNLSSSIKNAVKGKYINPINDDDFSIVAEGIKKAKEIIARTSGSSPKPKSSSKKTIDLENQDTPASKNKKLVNTTKYNKRLTDINFYPSGQKSLIDFIKDFKIKNDSEKNLLFTHYLSEILKIAPITLDHIYTCYDEVNHKIPENMVKSLGNTKNRTGWLKTTNANIEITTKGKNKIKFWDKKD